MTTPPTLDNNSPAFPAMGDMTYKGITGRDWFAGQALAGIMSNAELSGKIQMLAVMRNPSEREFIASICYSLADAMIAYRNSTSTNP